MIDFTFLGGASEVGKSAFLLKSGKTSLMLDCGLKLTDPPSYPKLPKGVDAMLLSHAHLDHSGSCPALYRKNVLPVYGTDVTFELARLLQHDSLKVNRAKRYPSPYNDDDVDSMARSEIPLLYNEGRKISEDVFLTLFDAGHIPGSAGILLEIDGRRVFYTGDVNLSDTRLLKGGEVPEADILILESTYGNRNHPDRTETENDFLREVKTTLVGGGVVLVPAFGVGRSQEILMILHGLGYPVYLDGMAKTVLTLLLEYPEYLKDPDMLQEAAKDSIWIKNRRQRKEVYKEPCVIVTTAGMLTGGPIMDYLGKLHKNHRSAIFLTGYQVEGTNGRMLLEKGHVLLESGRKLNVEMNVHQYDFSAHADHEGLLEIVDRVSPETIFCVHGDPEGCETLRQKLGGKYEVHVPTTDQTIQAK